MEILAKTSHIARTLGRTGLNALLPPLCPATGENVVAPGEMGPSGWSALHFVEEPYCVKCSVPFSAEYGEGVLCPSCIAEPPSFEQGRAAVVYNDASHGLIVGFKHSDRTELAPMFAKWMSRAGGSLFTPKTTLMPVPLHRTRLASRRYNQAALLAQAISRETSSSISLRALRRVRSTPPQKNLSADARRRNVAGAFAVHSDFIDVVEGAHIILIDDVLTTGATLSAAARVLMRAGAVRVDALVLARVVKGGIGAI